MTFVSIYCYRYHGKRKRVVTVQTFVFSEVTPRETHIPLAKRHALAPRANFIGSQQRNGTRLEEKPAVSPDLAKDRRC